MTKIQNNIGDRLKTITEEIKRNTSETSVIIKSLNRQILNIERILEIMKSRISDLKFRMVHHEKNRQ